MAQRKEEVYKFTPGAAGVGKIKFPGHVETRNLVMITNTTTGTIILNHFDAGKKTFARSHTHVWPGDLNFPDPDFPWSIDGTCEFTLSVDTSAMSSTDDLSILIDDFRSGTKFRPYDHGLDAVERMRVSNPESRIDTDFELGTQETKWESIGYNRNHVSFFRFGGESISTPGGTVSPFDLESDGAGPNSLITGQVSSAADNPVPGDAVVVEGSDNANADGIYLVISNPSATSYTYFASGVVPAGQVDNVNTAIRKGGKYTGGSLPVVSTLEEQGGGNTAVGRYEVTFAQPHGLLPGSAITIYDDGNTGAQYVGAFFVQQVIDETSLIYEVPSGGAALGTGVTVTPGGTLVAYARDDSFVNSDPFDGGVNIGTGLPLHAQKVVRQSKDYFRYQSGKGVFWSSAVSFQPRFYLSDVGWETDNPGEISWTVTEEHNLQPGAVIFVENVLPEATYYGQYTVKKILSQTKFTTDPISGQTPTGDGTIALDAKYTVEEWSGSSIRAGMFDDQNGVFFEYDGRKINVCKKTGVTKLVGTVAISNHTVTGTGTKFLSQVKTNQIIIIRGMSFIVTGIQNDTTLFIAPGNRAVGVTISGATATIVNVLRIPQEDWNYDTCDGKGPSGFLLRPRYLQMIGINYSWYGSGYIDFMIRGPLGEWIKVHRMPNSNIFSEAYLRSGNLPARYEITNCGGFTSINNSGSALATGATSIPISDARYFPDPPTGSGLSEYIAITGRDTANGNVQKIEVVGYTGVTRSTTDFTGILTGCTRRTFYTRNLNGRTYERDPSLIASTDFKAFQGTTDSVSWEDGTSILLLGTTFAGSLKHWGASVVKDGGFDRIPGFIFSYEVPVELTSAAQQKTALAFRLCPAVSNSQPQAFGVREIINRQELRLKSIEVTNNRGFETEISGLLNPRNLGSPNYIRSSGQTIGGATTFQQTFTEIAGTAQGGGIINTSTIPTNTDLLFTFVSPKEVGATTFDLSQLKNLENSVQGGNNVYPDGPETLIIWLNVLDTVSADNTNLGTTPGTDTATFDIILRWEEAGS